MQDQHQSTDPRERAGRKLISHIGQLFANPHPWFLLAAVVIVIAVLLIRTTLSGSNPVQDGLFARLTANSWCNKREIESSRSKLAPTSKHYAFNADDSYRWSHVSDYPESSGSGNWSFKRVEEHAGIIFLDSGDAIGFALNEDGVLSLEAMVLDVCETLTPARSSAKLPDVKPSPLFQQITADTWSKTDDLNLHSSPSQIRFHPDGRYLAEFKSSGCSNVGSWSLRNGEITRSVPGANCDFRTEGKPVYYRYQTRVDGDLLLFEGALYSSRPRNYQTKGLTWAAFYADVVEMKIAFDRPIRSGVRNNFNVELKNVSREQLRFDNLAISQQPLLRTNNSYTAVDENTIVASILEPITLSPGETHNLLLGVTLSGEGEVFVTVEVNFTGRTQPYPGRQSYVVDFRAP